MATFFQAFKWSAASEIAAKAIQPLIFIVLARILTPDDYGVVAAGLMIISFTQVFWDYGMGKALIQRQNDLMESTNIAFWVNMILAVCLSLVLFFSAEFMASHLFHDNRVADVIKVMVLQIILGSLSSIPTALLQKEMKFNNLFWVRLFSVGVPGLFSIPMAYYGMSYWALISGTLAGQLFQVLLLWSTVKWRPSFTFNFVVAKELIKFAFWVSLTGLLVWFFLWADSFMVGAYLGTHPLGLFRTGNTFVIMIFDGILFGPLLPVLYSYFSKFQGNIEWVKTTSVTMVRIIAMVAIPLCILLFVLSDTVSNIVFGNKWDGIGFIIGIMSIMRGFGWLVSINSDIYRALGKPEYETAILAFACAFFLPAYFVSIQFGFSEFVITRLVLGMLSLIPHFILFKKVFKISLSPILRTVLICTLSSITIFAVDILVNKLINNDLMQILVTSTISILLAGTLIFFLEHTFVTDTFKRFFRNPFKSS